MSAEPSAPVEQALLELQRRVEELEQSPNSVPPELRQRIDALKARAHIAPTPMAPQVYPVARAPVALAPYGTAASAGTPPHAFVPTNDISIDLDVPFDGRARRRRVVVRFVVLVLVIFGALLGAMAYSYTPQARVLLKQ